MALLLASRVYLYVCAQSLSHVQLFVTPWTVTHQTPLFMIFSRQEYWSGLPFPPAEDLPNQGNEPTVSCVFCIGKWIIYH